MQVIEWVQGEGVVSAWEIPGSIPLPPTPVELMSRAEKAEELQELLAEESRLAAEKLELALAMAEDSRADSPDGEVDEFFADELALVLNCSRAAAASLHRQGATLTERLPATFAALKTGQLDWPRARALADELGEPADDTDPAIIAAVEAAVLPRATELSIRRLKDLVRGELIARDAEAAERRRRLAEQAANVAVRRGEHGMSALVSDHRQDRTAAMYDAIDRYAWLRKKDGDVRPINVLRAEVHEDLVLRPWQNYPAVTARLDIAAPLPALHAHAVAAGRAAPTAWVNGSPITAAHLRQLLAEWSATGVPVPPGGTLNFALYDGDGRLRATATPTELRSLATTGCPEHADTDCGCAVLAIHGR